MHTHTVNEYMLAWHRGPTLDVFWWEHICVWRCAFNPITDQPLHDSEEERREAGREGEQIDDEYLMV